eukprot:365424-Chlamydomonas_euryale.AAC.37
MDQRGRPAHATIQPLKPLKGLGKGKGKGRKCRQDRNQDEGEGSKNAGKCVHDRIRESQKGEGKKRRGRQTRKEEEGGDQGNRTGGGKLEIERGKRKGNEDGTRSKTGWASPLPPLPPATGVHHTCGQQTTGGKSVSELQEACSAVAKLKTPALDKCWRSNGSRRWECLPEAQQAPHRQEAIPSTVTKQAPLCALTAWLAKMQWHGNEQKALVLPCHCILASPAANSGAYILRRVCRDFSSASVPHFTN